jgi:hypothetical protein
MFSPSDHALFSCDSCMRCIGCAVSDSPQILQKHHVLAQSSSCPQSCDAGQHGHVELLTGAVNVQTADPLAMHIALPVKSDAHDVSLYPAT